jgi:hypothetical protein
MALLFAAFALLVPLSLTWYRGHFAMRLARAFDAGAPTAAQRVLIATQGSLFKDALVSGIVNHLKSRPVYVSVIDVSGLPKIETSDWNAIVVIHTWEYSKPQADAKAFVDRLSDRGKIIVVTTSGSGAARMPGVDAISAASLMDEPPMQLATISQRLDALLAGGGFASDAPRVPP